jgi:hypothetical protein
MGFMSHQKKKKEKQEARGGSWAWWCMTIIPAIRRLRHKDLKFKAI